MKYILISKDTNWLDSVTTSNNWIPQPGLFTQSASKIAKALFNNSENYKQAMSRLNFYINRAGSNLSSSNIKRLELAKTKLKNLYDS